MIYEQFNVKALFWSDLQFCHSACFQYYVKVYMYTPKIESHKIC